MKTYIRLAETKDIKQIMAILQAAKVFLKVQGSPQWQDGYGPNEATIEADMERRDGYVLIHEGTIRGYAALTKVVDPVYTAIEGEWARGTSRYTAIHRVAIDTTIRGQGLAKYFLHDLVIAARLLGYQDIRIDTFPRNVIMEKTIFATGFEYRGMVHFNIPNGERKAYQLLLMEEDAES